MGGEFIERLRGAAVDEPVAEFKRQMTVDEVLDRRAAGDVVLEIVGARAELAAAIPRLDPPAKVMADFLKHPQRNARVDAPARARPVRRHVAAEDVENERRSPPGQPGQLARSAEARKLVQRRVVEFGREDAGAELSGQLVGEIKRDARRRAKGFPVAVDAGRVERQPEVAPDAVSLDERVDAA